MMLSRSWLKKGTLGFIAAIVALGASAQSFPSKPVTIMAAWPAGGSTDFVARLYAKELPALLGQPVLVENVPGAGGSLGANKAFNAPADGHMILLSSPIENILTPLSFNSAQYQAEDWRTILIAGKTDLMLVARKELPANNLAEFVTTLRNNASKPLSFCSIGRGSLYHLVAEKFLVSANAKGLHVPYNGLPQCTNDLSGGNVDFAFLPIGGPFPGMVDAGRFKVIATTGTGQAVRFPAVAPIKNTKGFEDNIFTVWAGVHVHAKTPEPVVQAIYKAVSEATNKPEFRKTIEATGATVDAVLPTAAQSHAQYLKDIELYSALSKSQGIVRQ